MDEPHNSILLPQDRFHFLTPGQLIHQLVEVTYLLHQRILDFFNTVAADHTSDLGHIRIHSWCFRKESLEVDLIVEYVLQTLLRVAGKPVDDGMQFLFRVPFLLHLGDVVRVDAGEGHSEDSGVICCFLH